MAIEFKIKKQLGVISEKSSGWQKELNLVSWNGREAKYDIREWDAVHKNMGKGVTFTREELKELYEILKEVFMENDTYSHNSISEVALSAQDILDIARG